MRLPPIVSPPLLVACASDQGSVANDCEETVTVNPATVISLGHRADDGMLLVFDAVLLP